jgi:hypothetical protein
LHASKKVHPPLATIANRQQDCIACAM